MFHTAYFSGRFKTVHLGHLAVHENDIELITIKCREYLFAVLGKLIVTLQYLQHGDSHFLVNRIVFCQQHLHTGKLHPALRL